MEYSTNKSKSILVIDDEPGIRQLFQRFFEDDEWEVDTVDNGESALELISSRFYKVIFLDLMMPGMDGLEVLKEINKMGMESIILMVTGHGTIDSAIQAMRLGAYDYIEKPITMSKIKLIVEKAIKHTVMLEEIYRLKKQLALKETESKIIGNSPKLRCVQYLIDRCADSDINVLVLGETGTGKELVAQAIHDNSHRKKRRMITVDCASLPEQLLQSELFGHVKGAFTGAITDRKGFIEDAHKSTLVLDEVGELSINLQSRLLRFIQNKEIHKIGSNKTIKVDIRIIAVTNRDLEKEVHSGRFRLDLLNRINTFTINVPPLRERIEDIPKLAEHFIAKYYQGSPSEYPKLSLETLQLLESYEWPGNIRELENAIQRALVLADSNVLSSNLFDQVFKNCCDDTIPLEETKSGLPFKQAKDEVVTVFEKNYFHKLLKKTSGNVSQTAKEAQISRTALHKLLAKHSISASEFRE